jgi:amidase
MHRISREHIAYRTDKSHPPVLEIDPGDRVTLETFDARTGTIQSDADLLDHPHPDGANPTTGPVYVRGAEPGDALVVDIEKIDLAPEGFLAVKAGEGLLAHLADSYATRMVPIENGIVHFGDLRFPANPMLGVICTAPAGEGISNSFAGPHGGNMDNKYLMEGSRIHLPVYVPGALWSLGDVHGAMGDGEITFIGLEICAEVTVRVDIEKNTAPKRPLIETPSHWITTGEHLDLGQAARIAAEQMLELIQARSNLSFTDAYMLMSAAVDVQICQCCEPGEFPTTARAVMSKEVIG